jgi:hypothetical protein
MFILITTSSGSSRDSVAGIAGWTVRGSNSRGGEIFGSRPQRLRGPRSLPTVGTGSLSGAKRQGCSADHRPLLALRLRGGSGSSSSPFSFWLPRHMTFTFTLEELREYI